MVLSLVVLLLAFIHQVVQGSALNPLKQLKTSQNTQTLLLLNLKTSFDNLSQLRASKIKKASFIKYESPRKKEPTSQTDLSSTIKSVNDSILNDLRETLITSIKDDSALLAFEYLQELYTNYPKIDHVNLLYLDEGSGVKRPLLHFALLYSKNTVIFSILNDLWADPNMKDSNGYAALEVAHTAGLVDRTYKFIEYFPICVSARHFGYQDLVYYAAAKNRADLLQIIRILKCYDFTNEVDDSPLEIALKNKNYNAADYLIKYQTYAKKEFIESLYIEASRNYSNDNEFPVYLASRFEYLIHFRFDSV